MLEYTKTILQKVSFDAYLFERELKKSIEQLITEDLAEFKVWCYKQFGQVHFNILNKVFVQV